MEILMRDEACLEVRVRGRRLEERCADGGPRNPLFYWGGLCIYYI